ncbi:pilus (MSHA type) biogenesis protein MshL [Thalassomonas actiniarum]|uniref:Pilus (MSHA type) biogenesis protein MshL n=1 Tax=Thalassomonas actiniarum TaxID=485447 RepID=A0AAE9YNN6_9GAMM|nr:pilus (MSHA type) biogenesis protein MshL [Thalassomonas actiniarum]WDD98190.1 pilus (MSHA type) biogenesis protein MshL [Thalassomonas actiniarum]
MKQLKISSLICSVLLLGCQSVPEAPTEINQALEQAISESAEFKAPKPLEQVPDIVNQELMAQGLEQGKQSLLAEKRLEIAANQIPAAEFFAAIVDDSQYSVAVHPGVSGNITLNLKGVTLNEVLEVLEQLYGFDINRQGKIIQVFPAGIRTETIPLNYLFVKRFGHSSTQINSGGVSENVEGSGNSNNNSSNNSSNNNNDSDNNNNNRNNQGGSGINIQTESSSDYWSELEQTLQVLIGEGEDRSVFISPHAGLVTVRALPDEIKAVKDFINDSQDRLRRQVIIEAKIMEVTLNDDFQQGINWQSVVGHIGSTDLGFSTSTNGSGERIAGNVISKAIGGVTSLSFVNADFNGVISLLSTQGNVQVLSSPRITATNNQKAVIKVGEDEFFVTGLSSNTTSTGSTTTTSPEVELTSFFGGIALDVTPQIDGSGEVILHVHPSVTVIEEQVKVITLSEGDYVLPLAQSSVRESDTIVKAKSGEIVVIGGLIETQKTDLESKTPLLGDLPILGEMFKNKSKASQKKELVIMLKPIVIGQDTWHNQLEDARSLLKQWFPEEKS